MYYLDFGIYSIKKTKDGWLLIDIDKGEIAQFITDSCFSVDWRKWSKVMEQVDLEEVFKEVIDTIIDPSENLWIIESTIPNSLAVDFLKTNLEVLWNYIEQQPEKILTESGVYHDPLVHVRFIEDYLEDYSRDWMLLSFNTSITPQFVEKHYDKMWSFLGLLLNKSIPKEYISKWKDNSDFYENDFYGSEKYYELLRSLTIRRDDFIDYGEDFIFKHITLPWFFSFSDSPLTSSDVRGESENFWKTVLACSTLSEYFLDFHVVYIDKYDLWSEIYDDYLTLEFIQRHQLKNYQLLSYLKVLTVEFIEQHIDEDWDFPALSRLEVVTLELVERHLEKPWSWIYLSDKVTVRDLDFFERNLDRDWDWYIVTSIFFESDLIDRYPEKPWDFRFLSGYNPRVDQDFVEKYIEKKWRFGTLPEYVYLTEEFISKYSDKDWNFYELPKYIDYLSQSFVEKHVDKNWAFQYLPEYVSLDQDFIGRHIDKNWDFRNLPEYVRIDQDFVERHIDKDWDFIWLSNYVHISQEFVERHIDKEWGFMYFTGNVEMTDEFMEKYIYKS